MSETWDNMDYIASSLSSIVDLFERFLSILNSITWHQNLERLCMVYCDISGKPHNHCGRECCEDFRHKEVME